MGKRSRKNKMAAAYNQPLKFTTMPKTIARETSELGPTLIEKCSQPFGQGGHSEWEDYLHVYEVIQQLRTKQAKYVHLPDNREQHLEGFMAWLHHNKVDTSNVQIHKFPDQGYGLQAVKEMSAGSVCVDVPRSVMLSTSRVTESALAPLVQSDRILANMPHIALAMQLLCELRDHNSFWQPYIKILPRDYSTPLYFTPEELLLLKGSPAFSEAINQFRNIARQYAYFFNLFQVYAEADSLPIRYFCYDEYRWAVSTVMTRQNQIPAPSGDTTITALIPLWDMCNHSNGQMSTDFDVERDRCVCYCQAAYSPGDQVYIFYGSRSNGEFLLNNGFVYADNAHDRLSIKLGISKNDQAYNMKCELLAKANITPSKQFSLYRGEEPVDSELLLFLRVFCMNESELSRCLGDPGLRTSTLRDYDTWISRENELKVWNFISTRAQLLLRAYKTDIQTDGERLRAISLTHQERMSILLLHTEKLILAKTSDFAGAMKAEVEKCPSKALDDKVQEGRVQDSPVTPAQDEELATEIDSIQISA